MMVLHLVRVLLILKDLNVVILVRVLEADQVVLVAVVPIYQLNQLRKIINPVVLVQVKRCK